MNIDYSAEREKLFKLLGDPPAPKIPLVLKDELVEETPTYFLRRLVLDLNGEEPVPAFLSLPKKGNPPYPGICYQHAHGGEWHIGKNEYITGRDSLQFPPYVDVFSDLGYAGLCMDHWNFGERHRGDELDLFKELLWKGKILWGMMMHDALAATSYLASRTDIDSARIASIGLSMGSTLSWWLAALDTRIKVCIDLCCLTDFDTLIETKGLSGHGIYYYVPGLLKEFSTAGINKMIAPRPHLSLAGEHDPLTPPKGLDRIDRELKEEYDKWSAADRWQLYRSPTGHFETPEMRQLVIEFFKRWL